MSHDEKCPRERCCVCDGCTGRAGTAEDSLYWVFPDGFRHGPLCAACYADAEPYVEYWRVHAADLHRRLAERDGELRIARSRLADRDRELETLRPLGKEMIATVQAFHAREAAGAAKEHKAPK